MIKPKNELERELRRLMILDLLTKARWSVELTAHLAGHSMLGAKELRKEIKSLSVKRGLVYE